MSWVEMEEMGESNRCLAKRALRATSDAVRRLWPTAEWNMRVDQTQHVYGPLFPFVSVVEVEGSKGEEEERKEERWDLWIESCVEKNGRER